MSEKNNDKISGLKEQITRLEEAVKLTHPTAIKLLSGDVRNIEKVLRDHLNSHIKVAREQLTEKDKMTIFKEFDNAIVNQLKKLGGDSKIKVIMGTGNPKRDFELLGIKINDGEKSVDLKKLYYEHHYHDLKPKEPERLCIGCSESFSGGVHAYMCGNCADILLNKRGIIVEPPPSNYIISTNTNGKPYFGDSNFPPKEPHICTLKEQEKCHSYNSILCLSPTITTCMYGKTKLEERGFGGIN